MGAAWLMIGFASLRDKGKLLATYSVQMKAKVTTSPALPKRLSLVTQTVQSLCDGISSGHWQRWLPGERALCEHLQVSRRTIGAALGELQRKGWIEVAHRQRRRILRKCPRAVAAGTRELVVVLSAMPLQAMPQQTLVVMDVLRERLEKAGFTLELHVVPGCFTAHPARSMQKLVPTKLNAVWVLIGSAEPTQQWFVRQRVPCLVIGSCRADIALPSVDYDHRAACRHAGGVLLRKGHRRIALVVPHRTHGGDLESEEGLREALLNSRGVLWRVLRHDGTPAHLCGLLDKAMSDTHSPTAFVVVRAVHALTVILHLLRRGHRIPQDVTVISRDDDAYLQSVTPPIPRYTVNPAQLARHVTMALRQWAESGTLPQNAIRLMPVFTAGT